MFIETILYILSFSYFIFSAEVPVSLHRLIHAHICLRSAAGENLFAAKLRRKFFFLPPPQMNE